MSLSIKNILMLVGALVITSVSHATAKVAQNDPKIMITQLSTEMVKALNEQREQLVLNPARVGVFARTHILPYLDAAKMARYVMGRYWRTASKTQQQAFVAAFSDTLIRSYSKSLLKLNIASIRVKDTLPGKLGRAIVPSVVTKVNGAEIDVVYRVYLNKDTQNWRLYDVGIEGISLLLSYRKAYSYYLAKKGIDTVIIEMNEKNQAFNSAGQ